MNALILAGGYGTRLGRSLPLADQISKGLLPLGNLPVIYWTLKAIQDTGLLDKLFIVSNAKYAHLYERFANDFPNLWVKVIDDGSTSNENRLGAIGDLNLVLDRYPELLEDNLLVSASDNLITNISLDQFVKPEPSGASRVAVYSLKDLSLASQFGIVSLDQENRVIDFEEKPSVPKSPDAAIALYFFSPEHLRLVGEYLKDNSPDQPGRFVAWLSQHYLVSGWRLPPGSEWYDIGSLPQLAKADQAIRLQEGLPAREGEYSVSPYWRFCITE